TRPASSQDSCRAISLAVLPGSRQPLGTTQRLPLRLLIKQTCPSRTGMAAACCKVLDVLGMIAIAPPRQEEKRRYDEDAINSLFPSSGVAAFHSTHTKASRNSPVYPALDRLRCLR